VIVVLVALLGLWISLAVALVDGFALPLATMKAEHHAAQCVHRLSFESNLAIPRDSELALQCAHPILRGQGLLHPAGASGARLAQSQAVTAPTRCALGVALCEVPSELGGALPRHTLRSLRQATDWCQLESLQTSDQAPASLASVSGKVGLAPRIDCTQASERVALEHWQCVSVEGDQLLWWGAATRLGGPCLASLDSPEQASPWIGRRLDVSAS